MKFDQRTTRTILAALRSWQSYIATRAADSTTLSSQEIDALCDALDNALNASPAYPMYQVICREHGKRPLTEGQYMEGLAKPDDFWRCPDCGQSADWDDYSLVTGGPPEITLETIRDELAGIGFGTDQDINGGDFVEYGGRLYEGLMAQLGERSGG